MNYKCFLFFFIVFSLRISSLFGQTQPVIWEPEVSMGTNINSEWSISAKVVMRQLLGVIEKDGVSFESNSKLIEGMIFTKYKLNNKHSLSFGILNRWNNPFIVGSSYERRLTEQYDYIGKLAGKSLFNRFRLEQRFKENGFQHRIRYKISTDFSSSNKKIQPGKIYPILGNEILMSISGDNYHSSFENRLGAGMGIAFKNKQRLQLELQNRILSIGEDKQIIYWHFLTSYSFKL